MEGQEFPEIRYVVGIVRVEKDGAFFDFPFEIDSFDDERNARFLAAIKEAFEHTYPHSVEGVNWSFIYSDDDRLHDLLLGVPDIIIETKYGHVFLGINRTPADLTRLDEA